MLFRALALVKLVYLSRPLIHAPFELSVEPTDLFFGRPPTLDLCFQLGCDAAQLGAEFEPAPEGLAASVLVFDAAADRVRARGKWD